MTRGRAVLVVAGVGLALLCLLLAIGTRVPRDAVVAAAERALGRPLGIGGARLRFLPQPAVEIVDVRAPDAGVVAGCVAAFEAERVRLRLALRPLVRGRAVVEAIDFEAPLLRLLRPADVSAVPAGRLPAAPGRTEAGRDAPAAKGNRTLAGDDHASFRLARLRIRGGRVQFFDEATATRWALAQVGASIDLTEQPEYAALKLRGVLRRQSRHPLATLDVRGALRWSQDRPRFRGRVSTGPFEYGPLWAEGGEARVQADERGLHLEDLVLRLGDGAVGGRARVLLGETPTVALALGGHGQALGTAFEDAKVMVRGDWRMTLAMRGPAPWEKGARRALRGGMRVVIRDGSIEPFELGSAVLDVVVPLRGREQTQHLRQRYPELFNGHRLRFRRLAGGARVVGRRVLTRDLVLNGADYHATVRGGVTFDGGLSLGMRLTASPRLAEDLLGHGALAAVAGAEPGRGLVVPLRIEGTVARPRVRATSDWSREVMRRALGDSGMGDLLERLLR